MVYTNTIIGATMALYWPVDGRISQQFATNPNSIQPNGHTGMDFAIPSNTPIKAAGSGTVVFANWATTLSANNPWWIAPAYAGICVVIDHGNGLLTLYAHLNKTDLNVGNKVSTGQVIGLSGSTGLSTGPHLHFEVIGWPLKPYNGFYGRVNPNNHVSSFVQVASVIAKSNQRIAGPAKVNQRAAANTSSAIVREIPGNSLETFTGYVIGENVDVGFFSSGLWYKDDQGYAWCGGFTTQTTDGLPNLTPPAAPTYQANQRLVGTDNVNQRAQANTSSPVVRLIPANAVETFTGYVYGETVKDNNLWYKDDQGYVWSGGFTDQTGVGLPDVTPAVVTPPVITPTPQPVPVPTPVPQPAAGPTDYSFEKDFDFVEYAPAHTSNVQDALSNPGVVVFPPKPTHIVLHQFDAKAKNPSLAGVINHFQTERPGSESSAHFAISGERIVQLVSLKDRAYHAGKVGNNYIGIEVDPDEDVATVASVRKLLAALEIKYGYKFIYTRHRDVPGNSTLCGADIHLDLYKLDAPVTPPAPEPPVVLPPIFVPVPDVNVERQAVQDFVDWVVNDYFSKK